MKKILIMAKSLGGGGSEVALIEFINALPQSRYDITLALLDNDLEYEYRLKKNIRINRIQFKTRMDHSIVSMYSFPAKALKKLSINRYVPYYDMLFDRVTTDFDLDYDIALDFYGYGSFLTGYLAKRICAKRKATWLHDEKMDWLKCVARYLSAYDKIFGVSNAVKAEFCARYPQYEEKVETFYNVIDINDIHRKSELHEDIPYDKNVFNILTVGRLTEQKGIDIAIEAASLLKREHINCVWYVIGRGRDEDKLKKLVEKKKLSDRFLFLGQKNNPYPYMKQCDLYVQPSRHEGYATTVVEARCLSLPIIVSDIPSMEEQIEDGVNGYVTSLNAGQLAGKIAELYKNPEKRENIVNNLKKHRIDFSSELEKLECL